MLPNVVKLALSEEKKQNSIMFLMTKPSGFLMIHFSFTFSFKLMLEVEMSGDATMEYSISAYLSTLAKTAVRKDFSVSSAGRIEYKNI